jgi:hypothetical protein
VGAGSVNFPLHHGVPLSRRAKIILVIDGLIVLACITFGVLFARGQSISEREYDLDRGADNRHLENTDRNVTNLENRVGTLEVDAGETRTVGSLAMMVIGAFASGSFILQVKKQEKDG